MVKKKAGEVLTPEERIKKLTNSLASKSTECSKILGELCTVRNQLEELKNTSENALNLQNHLISLLGIDKILERINELESRIDKVECNYIHRSEYY